MELLYSPQPPTQLVMLKDQKGYLLPNHSQEANCSLFTENNTDLYPILQPTKIHFNLFYFHVMMATIWFQFVWLHVLCKMHDIHLLHPLFHSVVFSDLRMSADYAANHPKCSTLLSTIIRKMVTDISALAPRERMLRDTLGHFSVCTCALNKVGGAAFFVFTPIFRASLFPGTKRNGTERNGTLP